MAIELGDPRPVVEFENGDRLERIEGREFRRLLLQFGEIDLDPRDLYPLLGEKNAHSSRVRGQIGVVELHAARPPAEPPLPATSAGSEIPGLDADGGNWRLRT